jgi:peptidyl-prolyl cis-trans isomerase C
MTKYSKFAALAMLGAIIASPVHAEDKSIAKVNGVSIPQSRLDMRIASIVSQGQPDSPDLRKAVREDLINVEVMAQEAAKMGLDKQAETIQQLELAKQAVLVDAFVQNYAKTHQASEDALKQEYEKLKARLGTKEYKVRHILVEDENAAKSIATKLKKGGKFDKLAEANSKDVGSRDKGGDLGWSVPVNYVKPFADAILALSKGQVSEPVQSQFGWHIIKLEDVRELKIPSFEEGRADISKNLLRQSIQQAIADLRTKAKIE